MNNKRKSNDRDINDSSEEETQKNSVIVGHSLCPKTILCPFNGCRTVLKEDQKFCKFHQKKQILPVILGDESGNGMCCIISDIEPSFSENLILSKEERNVLRKQCRAKVGCNEKSINKRKVFCEQHIITEINDTGKGFTLCPRKEKNFVQNPNCWRYNEYQCNCRNPDRTKCQCKKTKICYSCINYA